MSWTQRSKTFLCTTNVCVYGVIWVSGLLMSMLWIEWPMVAVGLWYGKVYVVDNEHRCILLMHFECTEIPWRDPEAHCCAIHPRPHLMLQQDNARPHVARICTQFLEAENIPVLAWPAYSLDMSPIEHIWDALDRRIWQRVPVPAKSSNFTQPLKRSGTNIPQATISNLINSMWRRCVALRVANGGHTRYWLVFGPPPPNAVKLHILEWPFIVASLRHTCTIIMLSNQHLDMPHLWGGWFISEKEKCSLTQI